MIKNRKNRYWSKDNKYRIIKKLLNEEVGVRELCRQEKISAAQLYKWKTAYLERGIEGLENSRNSRNPLVRYQNKKNLTELEKLEYDNMKLKIENARLKKGYTKEEVIAIRQRKSSKKSMK